MNARSVKIAGSLVGLASMGLVWSVLAAEPGAPSEFGRVGNKGEGTSTDTGPRQPHSTPGQDTQTTLGGARPTLMGEVLKIDGDFYTIKDSGGGEVRVRVDRNTSLDCAMGQSQEAALTTGRQSAKEAEEIPPTRHMQEQMARTEKDEPQKGRQIIEQEQEQSTATGQQSGTQSPATLGKESGGDVARGSGFVVGPKSGCDFKAGDKVKAEVSDLGTALFLKKISDKELAPSTRGSQVLPER
jgi:hypothetical protein